MLLEMEHAHAIIVGRSWLFVGAIASCFTCCLNRLMVVFVVAVMGSLVAICYRLDSRMNLLEILAIAALKLSPIQEVRLRMASHSRVFNISFRTLLAAIAEELGWSEPIYNQFNMVENSVYVVLRRSHSPIAYYFSGTSKATLAESEEEAAEKAVYYLVQKRRVIVDDVNLERRRMYTACSSFYKDKRTALELIKRVPARVSMLGAGGANTQPPRNRPKKVSIDFWGLLLQIVAAFQIDASEVEDLVFDNGSHVSTLRFNWENYNNRVCYFIGDCSSTLEKARQNLAKKIVTYLETIYGFAVKDANYYRMVYGEMRCGLQRARYLAVRDKMEKELWAMTARSEEGCVTPHGPEYQIVTGLSLPPPPKKPKTIWMAAASSSTNKGPLYQIPNADVMLLGNGEGNSGRVEKGV